MNDKIADLRTEHEILQRELRDPSAYGDPASLAKKGKRLAELDRLMELIAEKERCERIIADAERSHGDPELDALAQTDAAEARALLADVEKRIDECLIPIDPLDERNALLEVRAGTGGDEASLFAAQLLRMYLRHAERRGWKTELIDKTDSDAGGIKEAIVRIAGAGAYGELKFEGGVHRVQRIPATENKGRVHTSTATTAVMPEMEEKDLTVRNEDLRIDTFRAGGAGGQHVNKTESAVRITHIPTGIVVSCRSERSQAQNRERAMNVLRSKLREKAEDERSEKEGSMRSNQIGTGGRSEKIRTYNFPQDRLTDHRIDRNFHHLDSIMEGDIESVITALAAADRNRKLNG